MGISEKEEEVCKNWLFSSSLFNQEKYYVVSHMNVWDLFQSFKSFMNFYIAGKILGQMKQYLGEKENPKDDRI